MEFYLDYNASAPIIKEAREISIIALNEIGNPSSIHKAGRNARYFIEEARVKIANLVNCSKEGIIFTSGATEANTLALFSFEVVYSSRIEHESIIEQSNIKFIKLNKDGNMCLDDLDKKLSNHYDIYKKKPIVSVMMANNETGLIQPVNDVVKVAHKHNAYVHCDAVQAAGRLDLDINKINCDMLTLSSHKIGGPKGSGALIINTDVSINSIIKGGGQEKNLRSGTENLPSIAGFGSAAEYSSNIPLLKTIKIRNEFDKEIKSSFKTASIIGENLPRLPNTTMISVPGISSETLVIALDIEGFQVSAGSACSSGKIGPNRVLEAMGIKKNISDSAIRISLGLYNKIDEAKKFRKIMEKIYQRSLNFKQLSEVN